MLEFRLQRFAEGEGDTGETTAPQTIKVGDQEYTLDQVADRFKSYDKLQAQFTKVTQENSDLKKVSERAQSWLSFEAYVNQFPEEVRAELGQTIDHFLEAKKAGTVTQRDISGFNRAIKAVEESGDTKTADAMKVERDEALEEWRLDRSISSLGKEAKKEGVEFDEDEFKDYLAKYLKEEDLIDKDGSFDDRYIKVAYRLYKADKKESAFEKERKERIPDVGSGGSGIGVGSTKPGDRPKTIKEANERVMKRLGVR